MNVMFVREHLQTQAPWLSIKEDTRERNLLNVMFVRKDLHKQAPW